MEQLQRINVPLLRSEIFLEENVDACLEHEGVVDSNHTDIGHEVPARKSSAGFGRVHNIIADEEESLEELDHPAQGCRFERLIFGEVAAKKQFCSVYDGDSAIVFAALGVVVQVLFQSECRQRAQGVKKGLYVAEPNESLVGEAIAGAVLGNVLDELWEDCFEILTGD
jgi:hypothetical protein